MTALLACPASCLLTEDDDDITLSLVFQHLHDLNC